MFPRESILPCNVIVDEHIIFIYQLLPENVIYVDANKLEADMNTNI